MTLGAWEIGDGEIPRRMEHDREFLERHLEDWIERDPTLLGGNVHWVSRQFGLPDRSRLDLLGLTNDGTWVVVELKAGSVNAWTVWQAMHYFVQLANLTNRELVERIRERGILCDDDADVARELDELLAVPDDTARDHRLVVAGVGDGASAEAAAATMTEHGFDVPVQVVSFELLRDAHGRRVLLREIDDDATRPSRPSGNQWSLDAVLELADRYGVRDGFLQIIDLLTAKGYRSYLKKTGLNFNTGTRAQCFWVKPEEGTIHIGYLSDNFPSLFGIDEHDAEARLGPNWVDLPPDAARAQIAAWVAAIAEFQAAATNDA